MEREVRGMALRDIRINKGELAAEIDDKSGKEGSRREKVGIGEDR